MWVSWSGIRQHLEIFDGNLSRMLQARRDFPDEWKVFIFCSQTGIELSKIESSALEQLKFYCRRRQQEACAYCTYAETDFFYLENDLPQCFM